MRLHEDKEVFKEIVTVVSEERQIPEEQVEKDYFVSLLLQKIVNRAPDIVFKGGTSLSKCFKLINRFSEDIDLNFKDNSIPTSGERKNLKQNIIDAIEDAQLELLNPDGIRSKRIHNIYEVKFPNQIEHTGIMKEYLMVETFIALKSFPCEKHTVSNYILNYLMEIEETQIIEKYELQAFEISVQKLERTFIDKIFAVLDYVETSNIDRNSRHLYDLHMIWIELKPTLICNTQMFTHLFRAVATERSKKPERNISATKDYQILDKLNEIINKEVYKEDYENITVQLMYKTTDILEYDEVISTLKDIINSGLLPDTIEHLQEEEIITPN